MKWKSIIILFLTLLISIFTTLPGFAFHSPKMMRPHSDHWLIRFALSPDNKQIYAIDSVKEVLNIIDVTSGKLMKTLSLPVHSHEEYFLNIVFTLDGKKAYLSSGVKDIYIVDTIKQEITGKVTNKPTTDTNWADTGLVLSPDGKILYATDTFGNSEGSGAEAPRLHFIDTKTDSVFKYIEKQNLDSGRWGWYEASFVFNKEGSRLYFSDFKKGIVAILNTETNTLEDNAISYHDYVSSIAINPANNKLFVLSYPGNLYVTDLVTRQQIEKVDTGGGETHMLAIAANGTKLYVVDRGKDSVYVYAIKEHLELIKTIPVGKNPQTLCVSSDGSLLYVGNAGSNDISVIDIASDDVVRKIIIE